MSKYASQSGTLWEEAGSDDGPLLRVRLLVKSPKRETGPQLTNQCTPPASDERYVTKKMHTAPILHPHRFLLILQLHAFRGRGDLEIVLSTRFLAEAISHQYESKLGHLDWLPVFTKDQAYWELHIGHMKFRMLSEYLPYPTLFFSIPYLRGCPLLLSERLRTR